MKTMSVTFAATAAFGVVLNFLSPAVVVAAETKNAATETEESNGTGPAEEKLETEKDKTDQAAPKKRLFLDPDQIAINAFVAGVKQLFEQSKFDELETAVIKLREEKGVFGNGYPKIAVFYEGFEGRKAEDDSVWQKLEERHKAWIAAKPTSLAARIAHAKFLTDYAWKARGSGFAGSVQEEGWRLFGERLSEASAVLKEAGKLPEKDPLFWRSLLTIAMGLNWEKSEFEEIMAEAHAYDPTFWLVDTTRTYTLLPRWLGKVGEWEDLALETADRKDGLGDELYARIIQYADAYYRNIFKESRASWPRTKDGLIALRKKYPDSLELNSVAAKLAVKADDKDFAKQAFDLLKGIYISKVWRQKDFYNNSKKWAGVEAKKAP